MENNNNLLKKINEEDIPLWVRGSDPKVQQIYLEMINLNELIDNHPLRWITVVNNVGEEVVIDCKMSYSQLEKKILKAGGSESEVKRGKANRKVLQDLFYEKRKLTNKIKQFRNTKKPVSILDTRETELLELFGSYYSLEETFSIVKNKWEYVISNLELKNWYRRHKDIINRKRAEYTLRNKEFRIANEAGRMSVLNDLLVQWESVVTKKLSAEASNQIVRILEQARKEIKGDQLSLTVDGKIDINASLQGQENILELSRKIPINLLVIGLVAAKVKMDPLRIMSQLATSYYGNLNGFNGYIEGNEEINYPSNLISNYDWDEIKKRHEKFNKENKIDITDIVEIKEEEKEIAVKSKSSLLSLLKERRDKNLI